MKSPKAALSQPLVPIRAREGASDQAPHRKASVIHATEGLEAEQAELAIGVPACGGACEGTAIKAGECFSLRAGGIVRHGSPDPRDPPRTSCEYKSSNEPYLVWNTEIVFQSDELGVRWRIRDMIVFGGPEVVAEPAF